MLRAETERNKREVAEFERRRAGRGRRERKGREDETVEPAPWWQQVLGGGGMVGGPALAAVIILLALVYVATI